MIITALHIFTLVLILSQKNTTLIISVIIINPIKIGNNAFPSSTIFIKIKLNPLTILEAEKFISNKDTNITDKGSVTFLMLSGKYCLERTNTNITGKHQTNVNILISLKIPKFPIFFKLQIVSIDKSRNRPIE